ncbi:MAG TPA: DUF4177 domain-containing protein [Candidatus Atribacteria bacterium]|nr:DUF4177 domain-containing protein [Candidatus Atribacteria bacterium]HPT77542.1 DUF4177 domain-containing protein [Candidatus Atribacteria bacterium]
MTRWEYKTLKFETKGITGGILDTDTFNEVLNRYGYEGWELVSCFDTNQSYGSSRYVIAVMKRPKP